MVWVVNATSLPLYPQKWLGTHTIGGWVGTRAYLASTGIRSPDRPARNESLYRLRYPGPSFDGIALIPSQGCCFYSINCTWADPSDRAVWDMDLLPLACCDCGFESLWGMDVSLFWELYLFQVEASESGRSIVQRDPTECCVSECDREASIMRRPWPTGCCRAILNMHVTAFELLHIMYFLYNKRR